MVLVLMKMLSLKYLLKEILTDEQEIFTNNNSLKRFSLMIILVKNISQVIMNKKSTKFLTCLNSIK